MLQTGLLARQLQGNFLPAGGVALLKLLSETPTSVGPQGNHWVNARSSPRGNVTSNQCCGTQKQNHA